MCGEKFIKGWIEQRLKMTAHARFEKAGIEEGGQSVVNFEANRRPLSGRQAKRRHPLPGRPMARSQTPGSRHMAFTPARLSHHFLANQQAKLDADAGKADAFSARFGAGGDIVVARQLAP